MTTNCWLRLKIDRPISLDRFHDCQAGRNEFSLIFDFACYYMQAIIKRIPSRCLAPPCVARPFSRKIRFHGEISLSSSRTCHSGVKDSRIFVIDDDLALPKDHERCRI